MCIPKREDIPIGRNNAISRSSLARLWECSDRNARNQIAQFRAKPGEDGYAILSTAHQPSGYWRSNNKAEIERFVKETKARGRNTFVALRDANAALRHMSDQQKMVFHP